MAGSKPVAWIINIGTELTIGRIVNTNGAWLARELTLRGVDVRRIVVVPDYEEDVVSVIRDAVSNSRIVITTGGLGPTVDDRTLEFIAKALGLNLVVNEEALEMVKEKYAAKGLELTPDREKMAIMPEGARPIPNPVGTAPGAHISINGVDLFALPGVPSEMEAMFKGYVARVVEAIAPRTCISEKGIVVEGYPESELAPILKKLAKKYEKAYIKSHPKGGELTRPVIEVKVMVSAEECAEADRVAEAILEEFKSLLASLKPRRV